MAGPWEAAGPREVDGRWEVVSISWAAATVWEISVGSSCGSHKEPEK